MRILLIEDDLKIAAFVQRGLEEAGYVVDHVIDGQSGLSAFFSLTYDVSIIDIMVPKLNGLKIIEEIRRQHIKTPVLILSAKKSVDDRVRGLHMGGDDYLTKPFAFSELVARIQALLRRSTGVDEKTRLFVGNLYLNRLSREVWRGDQEINLQPLEFTLLEYLMRNSGRVVTKTMIVENVWSFNFAPQTNVVESRICKLREKVDKDFSKKLIHTIRGVGYVIKEND